MTKHSEIPDKIISRLPQYYVQLKKLLKKDEKYISSDKLADLMGFSSSLIRRDLSHFGNFGKKSYGYDIKCLHENISEILGFSRKKNLIIMGAGFLGRALANNDNYQERGYNVRALFDKDPAIIGLEFNGIKVLDIDLAPQFIKKHDIAVAALAVPSSAAQQVTDTITRAGVKAIWDFTETPLETSDDTILIEQNMNDGLCKISCHLLAKNDKNREKEYVNNT